MDQTRLDYTRLGWTGLDTGLDLTRLDCTRLNWTGLEWTTQD